MITIAIVDDEKKEREDLLCFFEQIKKTSGENLQIDAYESGEQFLKEETKNYDLICLDIDMEGMDGIETAKEIRKNDRDVIIMFITNLAQMAIKGYEVQALDFILKPVNYYSLLLKMQNAFSIINGKKSRNIIVSTQNGVVKFSTNDLCYVEVSGHYLFYHTIDGIYKQKAPLTELEEKLGGLNFKRCNNCYLINLKYVDAVDRDNLKINGEWLKISRPRKKEFMQALANYMGGISL